VAGGVVCIATSGISSPGASQAVGFCGLLGRKGRGALWESRFERGRPREAGARLRGASGGAPPSLTLLGSPPYLSRVLIHTTKRGGKQRKGCSTLARTTQSGRRRIRTAGLHLPLFSPAALGWVGLPPKNNQRGNGGSRRTPAPLFTRHSRLPVA
jgi:hypothetical protein